MADYDFAKAFRWLRQQTGEPETKTFDDDALQAFIEAYPAPDTLGNKSQRVMPGSYPQVMELNPYWNPTYDLNAAAMDVWNAKLATLTGTQFDFSDANQSFKRSQLVTFAQERVAYFSARRRVGAIKLRPTNPYVESGLVPASDPEGVTWPWPGNAPEPP